MANYVTVAGCAFVVVCLVEVFTLTLVSCLCIVCLEIFQWTVSTDETSCYAVGA